MGSTGVTSEITELNEELSPVMPRTLQVKLKPDYRDGNSYSHAVEDDLDRLLKAIDLRSSARIRDLSSQAGLDLVRKNASKKPMKVGLSNPSGTGGSESVTLKQALRRLCISQASEMAAAKRLTQPVGVSRVSEAGTIKRLYASVVVPTSDPIVSLDEQMGGQTEMSIMPQKPLNDSSVDNAKPGESHNCASTSQSAISSPQLVTPNKSPMSKIRILDVIKSNSAETSESFSPAAIEKRDTTISESSISDSPSDRSANKAIVTPRLVMPVLRKKTTGKKKGKKEEPPASRNSPRIKEVSKSITVISKNRTFPEKENVTSASSNLSRTDTVAGKNNEVNTNKPDSSPNDCSSVKSVGTKTIERSGEKGECSHSSKSSIGDYSSSTSISDDSHHSVGSTNGSRPHMSKDIRWVAMRQIINQQGSLALKNFKLLKRLGCGDIGTVYLAELVGTDCLFALKVMDIDFLVSRKKMLRAQTEREILQMLDHPFLPTLFSHFTSDNLSCLVMEYCPGGDLHVLRQKQPGRSFSEPAARFYVAEVLLALEYLHMLGVIYRDLKPENILVREDGHIMLSDFDLSLRCSVNPTLLRSSSLGMNEAPKKLYGPCSENSCIDPLCLQPSWVPVSCFTPRLASSTETKIRKLKTDASVQSNRLPQLVVEPTDARSNSFVGTHEYLAPEIIRGDGHGSAVDWWTLGVFLYELLFGRTPFKGPGNEETLENVVYQSLKFPDSMTASNHARDLIKGLLSKDPETRLGYVKGAAEIKQHPFFDGLNWALIRCAAPPETPRSYDDFGMPVVIRKKKEGRCLDFRTNGEDVEFELF